MRSAQPPAVTWRSGGDWRPAPPGPSTQSLARCRPPACPARPRRRASRARLAVHLPEANRSASQTRVRGDRRRTRRGPPPPCHSSRSCCPPRRRRPPAARLRGVPPVLEPRLRLECAEQGRNKYTEEELLAKIAAWAAVVPASRPGGTWDFVSDIGAVIDDDGYFSSPRQSGRSWQQQPSTAPRVACAFMIKEALAKIQPRVTAPFVEQGGLDLLADWMNDVREEDGPSASENLRKLLTVCKKLPVSEASLRASKVGKAVKKLTKVGDMSVQRQAKEVMKEWMRAITGKGTVTPPANAPSSPRPVSRPAAKPTERGGAGPKWRRPQGGAASKVAQPRNRGARGACPSHREGARPSSSRRLQPTWIRCLPRLRRRNWHPGLPSRRSCRRPRRCQLRFLLSHRCRRGQRPRHSCRL